jgi:hypothetical protein
MMGFSPPLGCIASAEFAIRKLEPTGNSNRQFRLPCLGCGCLGFNEGEE